MLYDARNISDDTSCQRRATLGLVVEPKSETAMVYRGDGSVGLLSREDNLDGEDVLPGFSYALDRLFE